MSNGLTAAEVTQTRTRTCRGSHDAAQVTGVLSRLLARGRGCVVNSGQGSWLTQVILGLGFGKIGPLGCACYLARPGVPRTGLVSELKTRCHRRSPSIGPMADCSALSRVCPYSSHMPLRLILKGKAEGDVPHQATTGKMQAGYTEACLTTQQHLPASEPAGCGGGEGGEGRAQGTRAWSRTARPEHGCTQARPNPEVGWPQTVEKGLSQRGGSPAGPT